MASSSPTVSIANATDFPAPSGTKVTTDLCPEGVEDTDNNCDSSGPSISTYPVLLWNNYTYWPLSWEDNDYSFAIVVTYGPETNITNVFEAPGGRYIDYIIVYSNESVSFTGQGGSNSWVDFAELESAAVSPLSTATTSSAATASHSMTITSSSFSSTSSSTSSAAAAASSGGTRSSISTGGVVGATIGGLLGGIIVIGLIAFAIIDRRRKSRERRGSNPPELPSGYQPDWKRIAKERGIKPIDSASNKGGVTSVLDSGQTVVENSALGDKIMLGPKQKDLMSNLDSFLPDRGAGPTFQTLSAG